MRIILSRTTSSFFQLIDSNKRKSSIITSTKEHQKIHHSIQQLVIRPMKLLKKEEEKYFRIIEVQRLSMSYWIHITMEQRKNKGSKKLKMKSSKRNLKNWLCNQKWITEQMPIYFKIDPDIILVTLILIFTISPNGMRREIKTLMRLNMKTNKKNWNSNLILERMKTRSFLIKKALFKLKVWINIMPDWRRLEMKLNSRRRWPREVNTVLLQVSESLEKVTTRRKEYNKNHNLNQWFLANWKLKNLNL